MVNFSHILRETKVFPNGLRVVVFERPGTPVAISLRMHMGSYFDPEGKDGLAHFCEHMLVSGTKKFPSKILISKFIEKLGGRFWASTGYEDLGLYVLLGDPEDIESGLMLLGEFSLKPEFDNQIFEKERGAVLSELRIKESNPSQMALSRLHDLMYKGSPLGRMILGTKSTIEGITQQDILQHYQNMITAENASLVIVGGVTSEEVFTLVEKYLPLQALKSKISTTSLPIILSSVRETILTFEGIDEVHIAIGYSTVNMNSEDAVALHVLAEILGGGRSSVLTERLRYSEGLVYGIHAKQHSGGLTGEFVIETSAKNSDVKKVLDSIDDEIMKIINGNLDSDQLNFVKSKLLKSRMLFMETSYEWMEEYSAGLLYDSNFSIQEYDKKISSVSVEDLILVTKKFLSPTSKYISLAGGVLDTPN